MTLQLPAKPKAKLRIDVPKAIRDVRIITETGTYDND